MHHAHEHRFPDDKSLARALADEIRVELQEAIDARGHASLIVSGGRTPVVFFNCLAQESLAWERVTVSLADERWVDTQAFESNERLVRAELLKDRAAAAQFIGLKNAALSPEEGAHWTWRSLTRIKRPFDVVLLGMGDDGHTASLFPDSLNLKQALQRGLPPMCIAMSAPAAPHARISMSLNALLDSRRIILHIQGESKWALYRAAMEQGSVEVLPIRAVLHQQLVPVEVFWAP